jgi:hypothetical protein
VVVVNADAIPRELRERKQWVVWKHERRGGKRTKVPYRASDARTMADVSDARTWGTFEQAISHAHDVQGIGYVFSADDPYTGLDFDACIDTKTGELHVDVAEMLGQLDSYQEISPSGSGMHAYVKATLGGERNRTGKTPWGGVFEVYDQGRFFTVTGNGGGEIGERQAQLDAVVELLLPPASTNGAASSTDGAGPTRSVTELLDLFPDVAKLLDRKGRKPGDGSASAWDFKLGCHAAERECSDAELDALIRDARRRHGEDKGERDDYVERTITAIRKQVPYPASDHDQLLAHLTRELQAGQVDLTLVGIRGSGHGDGARVTFVFSDGSEADFARAEHIATASKLGAKLATTIGIAADFTPLQARRVAAHVRRYLGRSNAGREHEQAVAWGLDFLRLADEKTFTFANQGSRFTAWQTLADHDPTLTGRFDKHGKPIETHAADMYARSAIVAKDIATGQRYVWAGWFQEYVRRTGCKTNPHEVVALMEHVGWQRSNRQGRIKATDPSKEHDPINAPFFVVPPGWEDTQEADE